MKNNLFDKHGTLKSYQPIPLMSRFRFYFKKIDMYAQPITFHYKNHDKFYTNFGALASLLVYFITLSFLINYVLDVMTLNKSLITS